MQAATSPTATAAEPGVTFANLRLAKSTLLANYLLARPQLLHTWQWVKPRQARAATLPTDEVVYHSWLPGMLEIPKAAADVLRELIRGSATPATSNRHRQVAAAIAELGWSHAAEVDLDALLAKARDVFPAVQNPYELRQLLALVQERRPRTVVEIGTAAGGLFYCLSQLTDPAAKMISIDILGGSYGGGQTTNDTLVFSTFGPPSQKFHFLRQRSFHYNTWTALEKILDGGAIDLLLIDGDHSYGGVKADFEMYGEFVAADGMIAMHDICEFPLHLKQWREGNDVNIFWKELKEKGYSTRAIIDDRPIAVRGEGESLLASRWPSLGFGVVFGNSKIDG